MFHFSPRPSALLLAFGSAFELTLKPDGSRSTAVTVSNHGDLIMRDSHRSSIFQSSNIYYELLESYNVLMVPIFVALHLKFKLFIVNMIEEDH